MKRILQLLLVLAAALLLSGCTMLTVDQMYCLPRRSQQYNDLQVAIDAAMVDRQYCAPLSGEHQQTVQQADLDGDGISEYLLFAKGSTEKPLVILIFSRVADAYVLTHTIESSGTAFDRVEYVQMDGLDGVEIVVGKQVSDQVLRSVSVYSFSGGRQQQLISAKYSHFLTVNLDGGKGSNLMLLRPGNGEQDNGVAVLYDLDGGNVRRSGEVKMSEPAEKLMRIITGTLHGGKPAVFVGSAVAENSIITDIYTVVNGEFTNISLSNESGTSVQTLRNYYVYADDIDDDGVVELPDVIADPEQQTSERSCMIRWYSMKPDGSVVDKLYTFHDFESGWYLQLDVDWADRVTVTQRGSAYDFYLREQEDRVTKIFTIYCFRDQDRETLGVSENRFVLHKAEAAVYAAHLEAASGTLDISREDMIEWFRLIRHDWKTGET